MSLKIVTGPMYSGKTKRLLSERKALQYNPTANTVCITHTYDDRYTKDGKIVAHDGESYPAIPLYKLLPFADSDPRYTAATHILIEEAQFFPDLYDFVVRAVDIHNKHILCAGLDGDYMRRPFGQILELVPHCDSLVKLVSDCSLCEKQGTAIFTARLRGKGGEQVLIGGKDAYEPMCRKHFLEYYYK